MTNQLFRDYLDGRIPGHETPRTAFVELTIEWDDSDRELRRAEIWSHFNKIMDAYKPYTYHAPIPDYGAQRGLTGLERAHFNDAVEKMARANPWTREECATMLGKIMDLAAKAELGPLRHEPPADPRARALWAKQHQGTGPAMTPLRVRGRTTHYKQKG